MPSISRLETSSESSSDSTSTTTSTASEHSKTNIINRYWVSDSVCDRRDRSPTPVPSTYLTVSTPRDVSSSETESDELASGRVSFVAGRRIESWEQ